jgi:hypothetical protein
MIRNFILGGQRVSQSATRPVLLASMQPVLLALSLGFSTPASDGVLVSAGVLIIASLSLHRRRPSLRGSRAP